MESLQQKDKIREDIKMSVVQELIKKEADGSISFGNYELNQKSKVSDFEVNGDIYKVKTFSEITKLERNEMFVYESVPGTAVSNFVAKADCVEFNVEGNTDAQVTVEMEADTEYTIEINGESTGTMKTNLGGKLSMNVELEPGKTVAVRIVK